VSWSLLTSMYVPSLSPMLVDKTMALAGISDWKTRRFQIDIADILASHFSSMTKGTNAFPARHIIR